MVRYVFLERSVHQMHFKDTKTVPKMNVKKARGKNNGLQNILHTKFRVTFILCTMALWFADHIFNESEMKQCTQLGTE